MTLERFRRIVEAYGADPGRWPADERGAAQAFAAAHPALCRPVLDEAVVLDSWLAEDRVEPAGAPLAARLVASAPASRAARRSGRRLVWSGLGFAGIGFAGALAGALTVAVLLPALAPPAYDDDEGTVVTAFDDISPNIDDEEVR